jgi:uncharacterized protein (DUF58 family)
MATRRLSLTSRGAFAVGIAPCSALAGVLIGAEELVLLAVALGALLSSGFVQCVVRGRRARDGWRVAVHLSGSEVEIDQPATMKVVLTASGRSGAVPTRLESPTLRWRRTRPGLASEPLQATINPSMALNVPLQRDTTPAVFEFESPTGQRGVFALAGLRHWCFDSVGLFAYLIGVGPSATLTVYPIPVDARLEEHLLRGNAGVQLQHTLAPTGPARRDNMGDFAGLRPYVPGDRLRLLYWPALARTGELLVREFEDVAPSVLHVVVDVRPLLGHRGNEAVLAVAAGIGLRALALGTTLELSTSAGERVGIGPGPQAEAALLRAVAGVETAPSPASSGRRRARGPVINAALHGFAPHVGEPLVITTRSGAATLPNTLGFSQLIVAS